MRRFVEGVDRGQTTLFPECLEDWIGEDNPVRLIDVFVEELDLAGLGPSHHRHVADPRQGSRQQGRQTKEAESRLRCSVTDPTQRQENLEPSAQAQLVDLPR
jgi:hypothetical protein